MNAYWAPQWTRLTQGSPSKKKDREDKDHSAGGRTLREPRGQGVKYGLLQRRHVLKREFGPMAPPC